MPTIKNFGATKAQALDHLTSAVHLHSTEETDWHAEIKTWSDASVWLGASPQEIADAFIEGLLNKNAEDGENQRNVGEFMLTL